jgi:hypothetical protein
MHGIDSMSAPAAPIGVGIANAGQPPAPAYRTSVGQSEPELRRPEAALKNNFYGSSEILSNSIRKHTDRAIFARPGGAFR